MVKKILTVTRKNFQIFLNSKASSIMLILGPIILICLIGFALQNTSLKNIKAGVYDNNSGNFSSEFIQTLKSESFNVTLEKNLENCKQDVIDGANDVCIVISKSLLAGSYYQYNLNLYVDLSKQRTVWQIIGNLQGITSRESYNERQLIANDLKNQLSSVSSELDNEESKINNAITDLSYAQNTLSGAISNQNDAINTLQSSQSSIDSIRQNLIDIQNSNSVPPQYSSELTNAIIQIGEMDSNMQQIQNSINAANYNSIQSEINSLNTELYNARDSIDQMKNDLNQIEGVNINGISEPVTLSYESVTNSGTGTIQKELGTIDYIFPSFLLFFILFGATVFAAISRFRERKSDAYVRNILSKAGGVDFIASEFISNLIIVSIQVGIIVYIASFFLNLSVFQNPISLIIILLLSISIFVLIGILIGSALNSQESIIIGAVSVSVLFFIFSSIIVPVETLPSPFSTIVSLLPLTLLEAKLRTVLIFGINVGFSIKETLALVGSFVLTIVLIIIFYLENKHKEV